MIIVKDILKKVRKYEIEIRKFLNNSNQGDYNSIFKGSGIDFDDLRPYQYGDDHRSINWNITAKEDKIYTNTYKEDKEQSVFFLLDISQSQYIGKNNKINISKEIASVLTISALNTNSQVGLLCFSDKKELFIESKKGIPHGYLIIKKLFELKQKSIKTSISSMIQFFMKSIKKKSLVIILSDFIDENYLKSLKSLNKYHDVICLHIYDDQEINIPKLGIIPVEEKEDNFKKWINTSSKEFQKMTHKLFKNDAENLKKEINSVGINYLKINSKENYIKKLIKLFKYRKNK
ncbi:MAG: DUF58 domain-containing protein [Rhodothermaeota bacterium MED-G19]|nr:MAG: DUF58 domain-containing protein [Rhodothermaeota bacterium MED-G19]